MHRALVTVTAVLIGTLPARGEHLLGTYEHATPECKVKLEALNGVTGDHYRLRPACRLSLDSTRAAIADLLPQALGGQPVSELRLSLGRVDEYPWLSELLATAALRSSQWDAKRGRPPPPDQYRENIVVAKLLGNIEELRTLIPGWDLQNVSVEKVLVAPVSKLTGLHLGDANPRAKLPFDAQLYVQYRANAPR